MFIQWNLINWPSPPSHWHKWSTNVPHSSWEYSCQLVIYYVCAINNVLPQKEIFKENSLSFGINASTIRIFKVFLKGNDSAASNFKEVVIIVAVIFSCHNHYCLLLPGQQLEVNVQWCLHHDHDTWGLSWQNNLLPVAHPFLIFTAVRILDYATMAVTRSLSPEDF